MGSAPTFFGTATKQRLLLGYACEIPRCYCRVRKFSTKGHFPLGGIFRPERHFLLFKDRLAESGRQKTKENIIPRGKFVLVENSPKSVLRVNSADFEVGENDQRKTTTTHT